MVSCGGKGCDYDGGRAEPVVELSSQVLLVGREWDRAQMIVNSPTLTHGHRIRATWHIDIQGPAYCVYPEDIFYQNP